jgi:hypothetical protein
MAAYVPDSFEYARIISDGRRPRRAIRGVFVYVAIFIDGSFLLE